MKTATPNKKLVWAKVKGYPWWPATVTSWDEQADQSRDRVTVYFLGEQSHAEVKSDSIQDFRKYYQQHSRMRNKKLLNAIKLALEVEHELNDNHFSESQTAVDERKDPKESEASEAKVQEPLFQRLPNKIESKHLSIVIESNNALPVELENVEEHSFDHPKLPIRKARSSQPAKELARIPFRKYQEITLEGRIVDLLNNLRQGKDTLNEMGRLFKRLKKIKTKEVMNRYILTGLMTVEKLIPNSGISNQSEMRAELCSYIAQIKDMALEVINQSGTLEEEFGGLGDDCLEQSAEAKDLLMQRNQSITKTIYYILKSKKPTIDYEKLRTLSVEIYADWKVRLNEESENAHGQKRILQFFKSLKQLPEEYLNSQGCVQEVPKILADNFIH